MNLDREHERLLRGEGGEARRFAMEILTKVGDAVGAKELVPVKSAHVLAHYSSLHEAGIDLLERFAAEGGAFGVPTTVDPASIDLENWESFGIPKEYAEKQLRLCRAYAQLGGIQCWTCVQYQVCNFPKAGEAVAWAESSSVVYANSVIGCRSNKITSGMDIACAIIGATPKFGMLEDAGRTAALSFKMAVGTPSDLDYRSVGFLIGRTAGARIPALEGLPKDIISDELKHLGAAAAAAGPATMIHYVGITPGSMTLMQATGGEKVEEVEIERSDVMKVEDELNETDEAPDLVALGVPHLSAGELGQLARMLEGRKMKKAIRMYAYTSKQAYDMALRTGIASEIQSAGARLSHSTDGEISPLKLLGFNTVLTNSAKLAEIVSAEGEIKTRYAPLKKIVEEVTS